MSAPLIDFNAFLTTSGTAREQVAREVYEAIKTSGFFYLRGSGITQEHVETMLGSSRSLFAMPDEVKLARQWSGKMPVMGYVARERESLDESRPADLKEAFNVPPPDDNLGVDTLNLIWPDQADPIRKQADEFGERCFALGQQVMNAVALSLGLDETHFSSGHRPADQLLRLLHYFPKEESGTERQIGAGDHQDHGTLTLLFQDSAGGLEFFSKEGNWESLPAIEGAVLVNAGDMLERWTGGAVRSAPHRVLTTSRHRYSIAYFFIPQNGVVLSCPATPRLAGTPESPSPFTAEEFLLLRSLRRTERFFRNRGVKPDGDKLPKGLLDMRNLIAERLGIDSEGLERRLSDFGHVEQHHMMSS